MDLRRLFEVYPPQPRATMPLGVRVNGVVYAGNLTGADPVTGAVDPELEAQLIGALRLLRHAVERAGATLEDVLRVAVSVAQREDAELVELAVRDSLRGAEVETYTLPLPAGHLVRLDAVALLPEETAEVAEVRLGQGVAGVRIGGVLFSAGITAADAETGELPGEDVERQMRAAFENLDRFLEAAGADARSVLRIGGYLRDLGDKDVLNRAMVARFPDSLAKPVHKYVPAALPEGVAVSLQVLARLDAERRILEIPGIVHNDPISLGALAGNLLVSSRVQGRLEASAVEQAERLIQSHARTLLEHVGGELRHVTQTVWGIGDPKYAADIASAMQRTWVVGGPELHIIEADFPHSPLPRLEFTALLGAQITGPEA